MKKRNIGNLKLLLAVTQQDGNSSETKAWLHALPLSHVFALVWTCFSYSIFCSLSFFKSYAMKFKKYTFYSQRFYSGHIAKTHLWERESQSDSFLHCWRSHLSLLFGIYNILWPYQLVIELLSIISENRIMKILKWFYLWFCIHWLFQCLDTVFKRYYHFP